MSGSSTRVLLRSRLNAKQISQLEAFVKNASGSEEWRSFWLLGQPFTMSLEEPDEDELQFRLPDWAPVQTILICCHCRGQLGDVLLAFAAARLAEMFSGLIALGYSLELFTSNPSVLSFDGRHHSEELGDALTPECMSYWAGTPEFRMDN